MVASYVQLIEKRYRGRLDDDVDEFIKDTLDRHVTDITDQVRIDSDGNRWYYDEPVSIPNVCCWPGGWRPIDESGWLSSPVAPEEVPFNVS